MNLLSPFDQDTEPTNVSTLLTLWDSTATVGHGHTGVTAEGFPRLPTHVDILVLGRIWDSEIGFSQFPTLT